MRSNKGLLFFLILLLSSLIYALPCEIPDDGTGTIPLPPIGCDYLSPDNVWKIIDGLPPGTTIELDGPLTNYICGNANFQIPNATLYDFGVFTSIMHMAITLPTGRSNNRLFCQLVI